MAHGPAVWLPFVQPFGTVLIGLGAGLIAYRQWRTANNKVRLDLFQLRLNHYKKISSILNRVRGSGDVGDTDIRDLISLHREAYLYFDQSYIRAIGKSINTIDKWTSGREKKTLNDFYSHATIIAAQEQILWKSFYEHAGLAHIK